MIIKKTDFKAKDWAFTVCEITILLVNVGSELKPPEMIPAFAIIHEFKAFALSGILETYSFSPLSDSELLADNKEIPGTKKSLSLFFEYLNELLLKEGR